MTQLNMMNQDMYNTDSAFVKYNVFSKLIHIKICKVNKKHLILLYMILTILDHNKMSLNTVQTP